jgi:hypothetical protein
LDLFICDIVDGVIGAGLALEVLSTGRRPSFFPLEIWPIAALRGPGQRKDPTRMIGPVSGKWSRLMAWLCPADARRVTGASLLVGV